MIDRWNERLHCPRCRKTGSVSLFQDQDDSTPTADRISDGFRVVKTECGVCNVMADPQGRLLAASSHRRAKAAHRAAYPWIARRAAH
jgi:hypothetical protein